jgi:hypothetical protein
VKRLAAAIAILLATGCDHMVTQDRQPVYAAWEEGLTLVYANPSDPASQRLQVRVKTCADGPAGRTVVRTYTTLSGSTEATFHLQDGLEALKLDGGRELPVIPAGFPDRVSRWEERGTVTFVVGRARVSLPGVKLPDPDATGIWIESIPSSPLGVRRRTLMVPDLGEAETLYWIDGSWKSVNRLVSLGYTDPPVAEDAK